jgi:DNA-directed RNA polymerase subunit H
LGICRHQGGCIVDIIQHELVPKHEILSEKEKKAVLEKFEVNESQLPKIAVSDPVIKLVGANPGQVVKITRKSKTAGEAVYYRLVVKA